MTEEVLGSPVPDTEDPLPVSKEDGVGRLFKNVAIDLFHQGCLSPLSPRITGMR
jgi:hypothetical protein